MRAKITLFAVSLLVALAAGLSYHLLDRSIALWVHTLPRWVDDTAKWVSVLGRSELCLVPLAVAFALLHWRQRHADAARCAFVFTAVATATLLVQILKYLCGRYRPKLFLEDGLYGLQFLTMGREGYDNTSMPSGHTATVFAFAMAMAIIFPRLRWLWFVLAVPIALSRVFTESHYLSDVIAGACIAILITLAIEQAFTQRDIRLRPSA